MKERILLVDDEAQVLDVLCLFLTEEGYQCVATTSPLDALRHLRENGHFDLLLTDLHMPEINGLEVVRQAHGIDADLAIIVVTALIDVKNAIQAMRLGADDYVLKPFELSEISIAVSQALEKRDLVLENRRHREELEARVHDATKELEKANEELRATKEYLESLLQSTVDAIITSDVHGKVSFVNEGALQMLGYTRDEFLGMPVSHIYVGGREESRHILRLLRETAPLQSYETELRHKNGATIPVNLSLSFVCGPDGAVKALLGICKDITRQKRLERDLKEMSIKDSLTGLYNQRYFYDRLAAEIERARRQNHPLSLLLFDIDQFKTYNDCRGHLEGDTVLQTVGQIVLESTRGHVDLGFRYGGDEFTVILPEADEEQAYNIAERIRVGFEVRHFDSLTLSIGLMTYREGYSLRTFIQFTDAMMYYAKRSGGNQIYVYRPEHELEGDLASNYEEGENEIRHL